MTEPGAGSDLQGMRTTAARDGNHYVVNGSKTYITNGQHADLIIVVAKTDPTAGAKGISLILVEADREGFERGRNLDKIGLHASRHVGAVLRGRPRAADQLPRRRGGQGLRLADEPAAAGAPAASPSRPWPPPSAPSTRRSSSPRSARRSGSPVFDFQNTPLHPRRAEVASCRSAGRISTGASRGTSRDELTADRGLGGQVSAHRAAVGGLRRVPPAPRRRRLHERVPDRARCGATPACSGSTAARTRS